MANPKPKPFLLQLEQSDHDLIAQEMERRGCNRTQFIRQAIRNEAGRGSAFDRMLAWFEERTS